MTTNQPHIPALAPPPPGAPARDRDPETSHAAAASLGQVRLTASRAAVLALLRKHGPLCDVSIAMWARRESIIQSPSGLRTRRCELVAAGKVRDSGARVELPSGRRSIVWEAVPEEAADA